MAEELPRPSPRRWPWAVAGTRRPPSRFPAAPQEAVDGCGDRGDTAADHRSPVRVLDRAAGEGRPFPAARRVPGRGLLGAALGSALAVVASLTLVPEGTGWAWGAPLTELRWYLTGLTSPATSLQLVGNLTLLAAPAALAVGLWPALARPGRLAAAALTAGGTVEVLQFLLPLGRVVSPVDALLDATGAVLAGLLVAAADAPRARSHGTARGPGTRPRARLVATPPVEPTSTMYR